MYLLQLRDQIPEAIMLKLAQEGMRNVADTLPRPARSRIWAASPLGTVADSFSVPGDSLTSQSYQWWDHWPHLCWRTPRIPGVRYSSCVLRGPRCFASSVQLGLHQGLAGGRSVIEHRSPGASPPHQAGVVQNPEVAAYRSEPLAGQRHKLRGALWSVEQDEDGRPRGPEQRPQRLRRRRPVRLGHHARAWVRHGIPVRRVPRHPALAWGYPDQQQLRSGDLSRRVGLGADPPAALPPPPPPPTPVGHFPRPAPVPPCSVPRDSVGPQATPP